MKSLCLLCLKSQIIDRRKIPKFRYLMVKITDKRVEFDHPKSSNDEATFSFLEGSLLKTL